MEVLYDVTRQGSRYASLDDMRFEAKLLGLDGMSTLDDLSRELRRRGLFDFSMGRAVKGGQG